MNAKKRRGGPEKGPRGRRPDIAGTAEALGVTEEALKNAMGDPRQGSPDFARMAEELGVKEDTLVNIIGMKKGEKRPPRDRK